MPKVTENVTVELFMFGSIVFGLVFKDRLIAQALFPK